MGSRQAIPQRGLRFALRQNISNETVKRVRDAVRQNSYREMLENLQALASNWLVPFLKVWGKLERGSLSSK
jgi:hypothetical protein